MHTKTVAQLTRGLQQKEYSSVELTQCYLDRIEALDHSYNSYITVDSAMALRAAATADSALANGKTEPLTGIPLAHKDVFCTSGMRTSCGSRMLDNFVPPYDATVIRKFAAAGAVLLGKTNMDEFAMGSSSENSYYGAVKTPGTHPWCQGALRGGRLRQLPPCSLPQPPALTPGALFASQLLFAASQD